MKYFRFSAARICMPTTTFTDSLQTLHGVVQIQPLMMALATACTGEPVMTSRPRTYRMVGRG